MELPWSLDARTGRLLRSARAGDREAFRALYRALYPRVWSYLARRTGSRDDCEELTAQTFERLLARLASWDERRGSVLGFVLAMARSLLLDELRARRPQESAGDEQLDELLHDELTPLALLERGEELVALRRALGALPGAQRELLALRFADGLTHRQIAGLLGLQEAAVKQRCSRTLRELRAALDETDAKGAVAP